MESNETIIACAIATIRDAFEREAVRDDADTARLEALRGLAQYLRGETDCNFGDDGAHHILRAYGNDCPKVVDDANDIRTVQMIMV